MAWVTEAAVDTGPMAPDRQDKRHNNYALPAPAIDPDGFGDHLVHKQRRVGIHIAHDNAMRIHHLFAVQNFGYIDTVL